MKSNLTSYLFRVSQKSFTFDSDDNNDSDVNDEQNQSQLEIKKPKLSDFNTLRYQEVCYHI